MTSLVRPVQHARYLSWACRACSAANRAAGETILDRWSFDRHLFEWSIRERLINRPLPMRGPASMYVALAFENDTEGVKREARRYWRTKMAEQQRLDGGTT